MQKKIFAVFAVISGIIAGLLGGSNAYATSGNTATISDGNWNICVSATSYAGSSFVATVSGTGFDSQLVFDDFETETCKEIALATGNDNTVTMNNPMGVSGMSYEVDTTNNKVTFAYSSLVNKFINNYGSFSSIIGASKVRIKYDANGGIGSIADQGNIDLNTNVTLTSNTFTYVGYAFDGWNTKADGTGTSYTDGETASFTTGGEVTLYAQWREAYALLDTGSNVNVKLKKLSGATGNVSVSTSDANIRSIETSDVLPENFDTESNANIISASDSPIKIYAWYDTTDRDEDGNGDNVIYIYSDADTIRGNADMSYMFNSFRALTSLTVLESIDTSNVMNMSYMFREMSKLTSLTLPESFDTSNVTNMSGMFSTMTALTSLTLPESFDTSKVTDMTEMFSGMTALTSLTLPESFDTSKVTNMCDMFYNMSKLTSLTLPESFDTSKVTNMGYMFYYMTSLTSLTLPETFNTSNVTNMDYMFYNMSKLTSLTLPESFNTSKVTSMNSMFSVMTALTSLTLPESFDTSNVTSMGRMFYYMISLTSLTLPETFNTSNVTSMGYMFSNMTALTSLTLPNSFDTSKVTKMDYMFDTMSSLTSLTLPSTFIISQSTTTANIFSSMSPSATLYAADATARSLWPGILGN